MKISESKTLIFLLFVGLNLLINCDCFSFKFFGNKPKCTEGACPSGSKDVTCKGQKTTKCCPSSDFKSCDKGVGCCPITSSCSDPKDLDTGDKCYGLFNDEARIPSN